MEELSTRFSRLDIGESGTEVIASHFDILGLKYRYYGVTRLSGGIGTYPIKQNGHVVNFGHGEVSTDKYVNLGDFSHICTWTEKETKDVTRVFFLCKDEAAAESIKKVILNGGRTADVLPIIQNNYKSDPNKFKGDKFKGAKFEFNIIALCGNWHKPVEGGWILDKVCHKEISPSITNSPSRGFVHHVTNVRVGGNQPHPQDWTQINSNECKDNNYDGALPPSLTYIFVSSTLYKDKLPTMTVYPLNGIIGKYYHRIAIPFTDISEKLGHIYYCGSAISQTDSKVPHMNYVCGNDTDAAVIKETLEGCISIDDTRIALLKSIFNNYSQTTYNIVAIPK